MTTHDEGIFFNVPMEEYRRAPGICQTELKEVEISLAHYFSKIQEPSKPPTPDQKLGLVTHSMLLDNDYSTYALRPDTYPHEVKGIVTQKPWHGSANYCKEWMDKQTMTVVTSSELKQIRGMVASVKAHALASRILYGTNGNNEVSCWKIDERTGLLLKGRADRLMVDSNNMTVVADVKKCQRGEAREFKFKKAIKKWGYGRQSAHYLKLFGATFFVHVVVEDEPPYAVACYNLGPKTLEKGAFENDRDLAAIKASMESGKWDGYGEELRTIEMPEWALKE